MRNVFVSFCLLLLVGCAGSVVRMEQTAPKGSLEGAFAGDPVVQQMIRTFHTNGIADVLEDHGRRIEVNHRNFSEKTMCVEMQVVVNGQVKLPWTRACYNGTAWMIGANTFVSSGSATTPTVAPPPVVDRGYREPPGSHRHEKEGTKKTSRVTAPKAPVTKKPIVQKTAPKPKAEKAPRANRPAHSSPKIQKIL